MFAILKPLINANHLKLWAKEKLSYKMEDLLNSIFSYLMPDITSVYLQYWEHWNKSYKIMIAKFDRIKDLYAG